MLTVGPEATLAKSERQQGQGMIDECDGCPLNRSRAIPRQTVSLPAFSTMPLIILVNAWQLKSNDTANTCFAGAVLKWRSTAMRFSECADDVISV